MDDKNTAGTKADLTLPLCILNVCNKEQLIPSCHNVYCGSRKYPYPTNGRDWNFQGGGGSKAQEIPGGGGCCINLYYFFQTGSIIPVC